MTALILKKQDLGSLITPEAIYKTVIQINKVACIVFGNSLFGSSSVQLKKKSTRKKTYCRTVSIFNTWWCNQDIQYIYVMSYA